MESSNVVFIVIIVVVIIVVAALLASAVKIVQQGFAGVVTRFGRFKRETGPGLALITPFLDRLRRVDMRETPRTGDRQDLQPGDRASSGAVQCLRLFHSDRSASAHHAA
jgi:regulator of protease activity HflC (stomatin/prohibitin superfamily)